MPDIFDRIAKPDIFDRISLPDIFDRLEIKIKQEPIRVTPPPAKITHDYVKTEKPKSGITEEEIHALIANALKKLPKQERVIEKVIEKEVLKELPKVVEKPIEKKDEKKYADEKSVSKLEKEIEDLKKSLEAFREIIPFLHGGSGVIGIPTPEGNNGKFLQVSGNKAVWGIGGTGGTSPDVYTTSNVTTTRNLDPTTSTVDNLYNVVASLIVSLQGAGIIQ